ncbi:hypothetical protein [Pseudonocardia sp. MH-G8]|uniref:hypothetical protein n=1 Tax=Pseudonocardia sp. MH-G8 TaxID=1854588 RepID=UPI000B9FBA40|nr:hypothetical protein [Pseudonocardia sp. MH-G8]OZM82851.1 hypothetical protein CFP66_09270 [Pseudonocardia sp. MH-G8]
MSDPTLVSSDSADWAPVVPDMVAHIIDQLGPSLPEGLALLATPHIALLTTSGRPHVVATQAVRIPAAVTRQDLADIAANVLADVQDLVSGHLATPWPLTDTGFGTHPVADLVGTSLRMRFSARNATEDQSIRLQPYSIPEDPPEFVLSG